MAKKKENTCTAEPTLLCSSAHQNRPFCVLKKVNYIKFLIIILLSTPLMAACGSDDDDSPSEEEIALKEQEEEFIKLKSVIVGDWEAYQYYNTSIYHEQGWQPISQISWNTSYTFKDDGTFVEHSAKDYNGTYRLEKNPTYLEWPKRKCKVFIYYSLEGMGETKKIIWLDEDYLRLDYATWTDYIPSNLSANGEASIRYKKK